jgi:hypothetical protein
MLFVKLTALILGIINCSTLAAAVPATAIEVEGQSGFTSVAISIDFHHPLIGERAERSGTTDDFYVEFKGAY